MKNVILALAILVGFASCTSKNTETKVINPNLPQMYYAGNDSTIVDSSMNFVQEQKTGKRCSDGKPVTWKNWKPNGTKTTAHTFTKQGPAVNIDSLNQALSKTVEIEKEKVSNEKSNTGATGSGSPSGSSSGYDWSWLWNLLTVLLWIAIACLALWLLYEFVMWIIRNASRGTKSNRTGTHSEEESESIMLVQLVPVSNPNAERDLALIAETKRMATALQTIAENSAKKIRHRE